MSELENLRAENRNLRILLGALLAKADGRIEVPRRDLVEGLEVHMWERMDAGDVVIVAELPGGPRG